MKASSEEEKRRNAEQQILAHKQLAETYVTSPNSISLAIHHLEDVIKVATTIDSKQPQAEAAHKLGLLYNMEGKDYNPKRSLDYLTEHFNMLRTKEENDSMKD